MIGDALEITIVGSIALLVAYPSALMLLDLVQTLRRSRVQVSRRSAAQRRKRLGQRS